MSSTPPAPSASFPANKGEAGLRRPVSRGGDTGTQAPSWPVPGSLIRSSSEVAHPTELVADRGGEVADVVAAYAGHGDR